MMSAEQLHPVAIEARNGYRLWVRFDDGAEREMDLSRRAGPAGPADAWLLWVGGEGDGADEVCG